MEVKKGYKQTEVGIIPEDWKLISYDDAFNFQSTATYSREQLSENGDVYYVHYGDIHMKLKNFLDFDKNTLPTVSEKQAKGFPQLEEGDLIIVDASEDYKGVGTSVEIKNISTKKAISGLHTFLLKTKNEVFVNGFKGYIHNNWIVKKQFDKLATGLKVYGVSRSNLKKVLIPLPPKQEQSAIAQVLSDTDELISSLEKLIEKKKLIKQGVMQQLLTGKKRLPGFSGKWEMKKLGDIAEIYQPITISDALFTEDGYNVFGANGIIGKYHSYNHENWQSIITCRGSTCGTVNKTTDKCWITGNAMVINVDDNPDIHKLFFYYLLSFQSYQNIISGTGQPQIVRKPLLDFDIILPKDKIEQTAITEILSDMDSEIEALEQKLNKYKSIKQGMMENLLTGKIRLV